MPKQLLSRLYLLFFGVLLACLSACGGGGSSAAGSTPDSLDPANLTPVFSITLESPSVTVNEEANIIINPQHNDDATYRYRISTIGSDEVVLKPSQSSFNSASISIKNGSFSDNVKGELSIDLSTTVMSTFKVTIEILDSADVISSANFTLTVSDLNGATEELITSTSLKIYNDSDYTITGIKVSDTEDGLANSDISDLSITPSNNQLFALDSCDTVYFQLERDNVLLDDIYYEIPTDCNATYRFHATNEKLTAAILELYNRSKHTITGIKLASSEDELDSSAITALSISPYERFQISLDSCDTIYFRLERDDKLKYDEYYYVTPDCGGSVTKDLTNETLIIRTLFQFKNDGSTDISSIKLAASESTVLASDNLLDTPLTAGQTISYNIENCGNSTYYYNIEREGTSSNDILSFEADCEALKTILVP